METTDINKTVYRSNVISVLDSFTSVRNVLAWEMFQDGQVRNYDGVIGDLQRLYPDIDFDSVTENIDPESIAANEDAIYSVVDDILNKLIENGISKDNFNYAIWACDNPENVADTYGVDIDDVSAYKITDGILLQDLGYEGQLYGVAEYPEEEWDVIESALKGGHMKTREDYKDYYLEQLTEQFGDMTERDYNSAKKFCYDEEWNLGEVGNMAEAIDGLGDAWTEYQKQYKEGFEIMNNVTLSKKNITSSGRWVVKTNEDQMDYIGNFFEGLPSYIDAESPYNEEKFAKAVNDYIFKWMYEDSDFSEADKKKITRNFLKLYKDYYNNGEPKDDLNTYYFEGEGPSDPRLIEWLHSVLSDKELNVPFTTWHYVESSKKNIKSSKETLYEDDGGRFYTWSELKADIDDFVKTSDFKDQFEGDEDMFEYFEKDHKTPKYYKIYMDFWDISSNGAMSEVEGTEEQWNEYNEQHGITSAKGNNMKKNIKSSVEDVHYNRNFSQYDDAREYAEKLANKLKDITIIEDVFETKVDYYVDGKFNHSADIFSKKENYDNLIIIKYYNDIFSVSYKGSKIKSSKENNMKTPIKSEYTGTNVSVEYGPYGEEKEFPFYDMKGETVEQIDERIGYYDEVKTAWGSDGESYMILQDRANSEDKIAVLEDDYNVWVESMNNEDYSKLLGNSRKAIKSASGAGGNWEYQGYDMDEVEKKIGDIGISFTEPLLLADDGTLYTRAGFDQWLKYLEREESDNWADAYEIYHRDTDEEFIKMCQDDFFQHDFGHTLTIYPEGLKSIAESVAEEIPSNEAPFAIPSGFAFNLYGEEEEPSGFNSYWIDDMSLDSESFIWGINPEFGNRFDVAIDPDYLWNGTENIQSSKKGEKKMKIQSKRAIKSGTSNFGSNDDVFGYQFPLVTYVAENYYYDEETDSETEERDYEADDWEYRDALDEAKDLADEMNIPQYDDYSEPYLCYEPFMIKFRDGYYEGLWIEVKEGTDETPYDGDGVYQTDFGEWRQFTEEEMNQYADKLNEYFNKLCSDYGWQKLGVIARFSNGETMYHKIDNSRKPIKSAKTVADVEEELLIDLHDIRPVFEENGYTLEDAKNFERMTWEEALPTIKSIPELAEMFEITSSRKSVTSGLTFRQAVQDFKAAGQWNDYYEMQQDWEAYKDGLERDGVISEKTRSTWGNPCTPEGFKKWNK